jgi:hypothetical protein
MPNQLAAKPADRITFDDLGVLINSWNDSYEGKPKEAWNSIQGSLGYAAKYIDEITKQLMNHGLMTKNELPRLLERASDQACTWATLCFAIGLEGALGNIPDDDVPCYIFACEKPITDYLFGYLGMLQFHKKVTEDYLKRVAKPLGEYLQENSIWLANQGFLYHRSIRPKYKGKACPFALNIQRIDIQPLRVSAAAVRNNAKRS